MALNSWSCLGRPELRALATLRQHSCSVHVRLLYFTFRDKTVFCCVLATFGGG